MNIGNPISSVINRVVGKKGPYKILTFSAHERYEPLLCNCNVEMYSLPGQSVREWNTKYSKIPDNYYFVQDLKPHLTFDACISHNPFVHIPLASPISRQLHIPIINIFHTEPPLGFDKNAKLANQGFFDQCSWHVFITEENQISWGFKDDKNCTVIEHGLDSDLFNPGNLERKDHILSVGNDYVGRNLELGFDLWRVMTQGLPVRVIGNTPGLSLPANSLEELITEYQTSRIFLNTSLRSPLPMSLMEAMATGCAIVTTNTNAICDFLTQGYDALIYSPNEPQKGREYLERLLKDKEECKRLGANARKTVLERFKISRFVSEWESLLGEVCERVFK